MFISVSQNSCSATGLHEITEIKHSFISFQELCFKHTFTALLCLAFTFCLSSTSLAQATLTDDHSLAGGPKGDQLVLETRASSASVFLKFNLSGVPAESNVSRATLKLWVNNNNPNNPNAYGTYEIDVRVISSSWSEQNANPQTNGPILAISSVVIPSNFAFVSIDITGLVREWINGTRPNNGVALGIRSGPRNSLFLDSKENTLTSQPPKLELVLDKLTGITAAEGLSGGGTTGNVAVGIANGGVTTTKLADGAVTSAKIASGAVGTPQLALDAVTSANIAAGSVRSLHLADGAVTSLKIEPGAVGTPQLSAGAVTSGILAPGAVGGGQLAGGAVNTSHIADSAVTALKVAPGQVVKSLNGLTDSVSLVAGDNVTISSAGDTLTISANAGGGGATPPTNFTPQQVALLRWYEANTTTSFTLSAASVGAAFDGANIWVAHYDRGDIVTKLRASDGAILGTFPTGSQPYGVAYDGANVWVSNSNGSSVTKLRASDGAVLGTYPAGRGPRRLAFDGANIWVANWDGDTVTKLRASDGALLGTYPVSNNPHGIAFDGKDIWVTNTSSNTVTKLRGSDGAVQGIYTLGGASGANSLAFDGAHIWAACGSDHAVKLRASDGEIMGIYSSGSGTAIGIVFDGYNMWIPHRHSATITKIRASDGASLGTFPTDGTPYGVAFDGANVWLTHLDSTRVSKY